MNSQNGNRRTLSTPIVVAGMIISVKAKLSVRPSSGSVAQIKQSLIEKERVQIHHGKDAWGMAIS